MALQAFRHVRVVRGVIFVMLAACTRANLPSTPIPPVSTATPVQTPPLFTATQTAASSMLTPMPVSPVITPTKPAGPPAASPTPVATLVAVPSPTSLHGPTPHPVPLLPDFGIQKSAQCDWAHAQCTFNIIVTNYGPDTQMGISITDTMTISFTLAGFGGPSGPICFMITPSIIRCDDRYPQFVPHGGTLGMGLVVKISGPLKPFQNCAYLLTSDANPQNNHACISIVPPMPTLPPPRTPPTP